MLFNSYEFLLFLPIIVLLYYLVPQRFRWVLLFIASCYFYMYFIPKYILILFVLILIDYAAALLIHQAEGTRRKVYLIISLAANICLLAYFKYINFALDTVRDMFQFLHIYRNVPHIDVILPIGLSFHTFQSMAYTIEVYKRRQEPEKHLGIYSVYVLFFPQMVAGPIERFERLGNQLKQYHPFKAENIAAGLRLVLFGLFIKMAVADQLAPYVNKIYNGVANYSSLSVAAGMLFFSFQIYADFWGYSTIALGSAAMMGITLMDNFRAPYLSKSISEFWGRWHISLSTWFRDYVYIPLGGNKVSAFRWAINILIVFGLSGLWHGANWTFLIWGLIHAVMYLLERGIHSVAGRSSGLFSKAMGWLFTFSGVTLAWVFFRSSSFKQAEEMIRQLFSLKAAGDSMHYTWQLWVGLLMLIGADIWMHGKRFDLFIQQKHIAVRWATYAVLLLALTVLASGEEQPFIYFQF
jgi:alginate O-acetyltransferase complex protein AlgI